MEGDGGVAMGDHPTGLWASGRHTAGPMIMLAAFVGGWLKQALGPDAVFLGGVSAASVIPFFTFIPSFMFILAGGPAVSWDSPRRSRRSPQWWNLSPFFSYHA